MVETKSAEAKAANTSVLQNIDFNELFGKIKGKSVRIWGGGSPNQPSELKYQHNHLFSSVMGKFLRFEGPYLKPLSPY